MRLDDLTRAQRKQFDGFPQHLRVQFETLTPEQQTAFLRRMVEQGRDFSPGVMLISVSRQAPGSCFVDERWRLEPGGMHWEPGLGSRKDPTAYVSSRRELNERLKQKDRFAYDGPIGVETKSFPETDPNTVKSNYQPSEKCKYALRKLAESASE